MSYMIDVQVVVPQQHQLNLQHFMANGLSLFSVINAIDRAHTLLIESTIATKIAPSLLLVIPGLRN